MYVIYTHTHTHTHTHTQERLRHAERENLEQQLDEAVRVAREEAMIGEGQACEALEIVAAEVRNLLALLVQKYKY
jgi:hypothetical protein